ncbi:MAG: PH domain-containing protein [Nitrospinae bacterium]|nr:PH domain-containing protein [Nitrospinota bacterium]
MAYIDQNLMTGERIIYRAKLHWIVFLFPSVFLFVALVVFLNGYVSAGVFFLLIAVLTVSSSLITFYTSEFGVTNKRVLIKVGLIRRNSIEMLLRKVEGIAVNQDIPGRILGYGTIIITGTGGSKEEFQKIDAPFEFRKKVQEQIEAVQE